VEYRIEMEQDPTCSIQRRIDQRRRIARRMGLAIGPRLNWTPAREVGVGPHEVWLRGRMFIDEVAGSTIHRESCERPGESHSWPCCFREIHDRISGIRIVHIAVAGSVQKRFEGLREPGFKKQSFTDCLFGSGGSGRLCARRSTGQRDPAARAAGNREYREEEGRENGLCSHDDMQSHG